jgi:hypothetical protein
LHLSASTEIKSIATSFSQRIPAATARPVVGRESTATETVCKKARASGVATAREPGAANQGVIGNSGHVETGKGVQRASALWPPEASPRTIAANFRQRFGAAAAGPGGRGRGRPTVPWRKGDPPCACTGRRDKSRGLALSRTRQA